MTGPAARSRHFSNREHAALVELAASIYGKDLSRLSHVEARACLEVTKIMTLAVDNSWPVDRIAVNAEITQLASESDREGAAAIRAKLKALQAEYAAKVQALLEALKVFGDDENKPDDDDLAISGALALHRKPAHVAAEWALRQIGEPAKVADIIDLLIENNYSPKSDKKRMTNTVFVALQRKDKFSLQPDSTWALTEWE